MRRFWHFLQQCAHSRTAWLFALLHATWFFLAVANMSPPSPGLGAYLEHGGWSSATLFAGRPFHFHYESLILKLLITCDLPAMLSGAVVSLLAVPFVVLFGKVLHVHVSFFVGSYFTAALVLLLGTLQWLMVGWTADNWLNRRVWGQSLRSGIERHFVALLVVVTVATAAITPIVNERSRQLGFRHGGISFGPRNER